MKKTDLQVLAFILLALILLTSIAGYFLPGSPSLVHPGANHLRMALTVTMTSVFISSAVLFLVGLSRFKAAFRAAYRWLAIGMIVFGLAMLQWPIIVLRDMASSAWAVSGVVVVPFIVATAFMYYGMRQFGRLLSIRSLMDSIPVTTLLVLDLALASGLAAHLLAPNNTPDISTETYTATVAWSTGFGVFAWLFAKRIQDKIGQEYRRAMNALYFGLAMLTVSGVHEFATSFFFTESMPYIYYGFSLWPFVLAGFLLFWAGYAFCATSIGSSSEAEADTDQGYIDSIATIAGLASRPEAVDPILDPFRAVTASLQGGGQLSVQQRAALAGVYMRLEGYLTNNDPLRAFTKDELRNRLSPGLKRAVDDASKQDA